MFYSYDKKILGIEFKKLRDDARLTRERTSEITNVSIDTIRRIEKGEVIPRYDTLLMLSEAYKKDLVSFMRFLTPSYELNSYYESMDKLIIKYDKSQLNEMEENLKKLLNWVGRTQFCNQNEIEQLLLVTSSLEHYYAERYVLSFEDAINGLKVGIPNFDVEELECYRYNILEKRLLTVLSINYSMLGEFEVANKILLVIFNDMIEALASNIDELKIILKVIFNISYNYHRLSNNDDAYKFANIGIILCIENDLSYLMGHLMFRKGVAEYFMGNDNYIFTLRNCIRHLKNYEMFRLADLYVKSLAENYKIYLEDD